MTAGTRLTLRALAGLSLLAGLVAFWPARDRLSVTWAPLALAPGGGLTEPAPGLLRSPGAVVDAVLDTVERPLLTGNTRSMEVRWNGFLRVPHAGRWSLGLYTDRPSSLWLGEFAVTQHTGTLGTPQTPRAPHAGAPPLLVARSVELAAGDYPVEVRTHAGPGAVRLTLVWQPPRGPLAVVPPEALAVRDGAPAAGPAPEVRSVPVASLATGVLALPVVHPWQLPGPVLFRWKHTTLSTPTFPPLYTMRLSGRVEGAADPVLEVSGTGAITGSIGGAAVDVAPGAKPEAVKLAGAGPWDLALEVRADGGELERLAIGASGGARLTAPEAPVSRTGLVLVVVALALAALSGTAPSWPDARGWRSLAVTALCALALALRLHHHTEVPHPLETEDELIHHWNGLSLRNGSGPVGWSDLPAYGPREATFWYGHRFRLAAPFLDWPPLMCALTGVVDHAAGAEHPFDLPLDRTRLLPILLGVLVTWLTYRVARLVLDGSAGPLIATALVATMPPAVAASRLVKADALLAALAMALCWVTARYLQAGHTRSLAAVVLLVPLAVAAKQSGLAFALAAVLALARGRRAGAAWLAATAAVAGVAGHYGWGCLWDNSLFAAVQAQMASAPFKPEHVLSLFTDAPVVDRSFGGGWMLFLWLAFLLPAPGRAGFLKLAVVGYTTLVLLTTWYPFGWYRLPLYPLLAVFGGATLARLADRPRLAVAFAAVATLVVPALVYRLPLDRPGARLFTAAVIAGLLAVPLVSYLWPGRLHRTLSRAGGAALVAGVLALNVAVSLHLPYLDQGLFKDRQAGYEPLAGLPGDQAPRAVRYR